MPFLTRQTLLSFFSFSPGYPEKASRRRDSEITRHTDSSGTALPPSFARRTLDENDYPQLAANLQSVLLLHGPRQEYNLTHDYEIHIPKSDHELLVKILVVGLNPIDWKAPAYNFGLPAFPLIAGRDFAGFVVKAPQNKTRIKLGDVILGTSTDYRDFRKSAFQEFAIATDFNVCRLPERFLYNKGPPLGVAFVAAALALGVCLGVNFASIEGSLAGPDLLKIVRSMKNDSLPVDIVEECLDKISIEERPAANDWLVIWGGSTSTGFIALQLAKLVGLKVICVVDVAKHGARLVQHGADLLVDRFNADRAISIITGVTKNKLSFAMDTIGRETATLLQGALAQPKGRQPRRSHLVGLTGLPRERNEGVVFHSVPIKLFHSVSAVGESLMNWLENLLLADKLVPPDIEVALGGLGGINTALEVLRSGALSGQRLVVPL